MLFTDIEHPKKMYAPLDLHNANKNTEKKMAFNIKMQLM